MNKKSPMKYTYYCCLFFLMVLYQKSVAQVKPIVPIPKVQLLSRVQKDKILLRWAANTANAWLKTNKQGFVLEKYVLARDGKRLPQLEKVWQKNIKVSPLETWKALVEKDNHAAIIAQALFGERFLVGGTATGQLANIQHTLQENQQRFSFSLLAADMSFEAAKKAGWGFEDTQIRSNEKYVYKIKPLAHKTTLGIKGTAVIASSKDYEPLPAPIDVQAIFGDRRAMLTWEYQKFKTIYIAYLLERSEDGVSFAPLHQEPLVNLNDKPNAPAKRMFYADTLAKNQQTYYYRVRGISTFGEKGKYSKIVSGKGKPLLPYTPRITNVQLTDRPNEAVIHWEFPQKGEALIHKFQLTIANKDQENAYKVAMDSIPAHLRKLSYRKLGSTNYIKIKAIGKTKGQQKSSFATLVQPIDTLPPAIPSQLEGKIDTLGVVKLSWKPNGENDFLGYRVFRGFTKKEEPVQLTYDPIAEATFTDTIVVKNLNSKVYYKVVAVDQRFNHSKPSNVLVLDKPDVIPPSAPVFSSYAIKKEGILVRWELSSEAAVTHVLSRKDLTANGGWEAVYRTQDTLGHYQDKKVIAGHRYRYRIYAQDKAGLHSAPSSPITVEYVATGLVKGVRGFDYIVDREKNKIILFWKADPKKVLEYTLYKQTQDQQPSTWRIVPATITEIIDLQVSPNESYQYHIRAMLKKGGFSKMQTLTVKF